ncbi:MAG: hypothetical protein QOE05_2653 [Actinomycetota bacterium]|jgi:hypothetical protein|nr:hypothetical protein [Actinomycetota bacterium]
MNERTLLPVVATPIACSLGATELTGRLADWRRVLGSVTARVPGVGPHEVVLQLDSNAPVAEIATLCADEVACCPFFTFELSITSPSLQLRIAVPVGAESALAEFAELVPASAR